MATVLKANNWPLQRDCNDFYGDPRRKGWLDRNVVIVTVPWEMKYGGKEVNHISIHKKCRDSLLRVLEKTWEDVEKSQEKIAEMHADLYSGSYVLRNMRGLRTLSMHSYACAIDWADRFNPQHAQHHSFTEHTILIANFLKESWQWGGKWKGTSIDAMHVQAARVR